MMTLGRYAIAGSSMSKANESSIITFEDIVYLYQHAPIKFLVDILRSSWVVFFSSSIL